MNNKKIMDITNRIKRNKENILTAKDTRRKEILLLKIKVDELRLKIERLQ